MRAVPLQQENPDGVRATAKRFNWNICFDAVFRFYSKHFVFDASALFGTWEGVQKLVEKICLSKVDKFFT